MTDRDAVRKWLAERGLGDAVILALVPNKVVDKMKRADLLAWHDELNRKYEAWRAQQEEES